MTSCASARVPEIAQKSSSRANSNEKRAWVCQTQRRENPPARKSASPKCGASVAPHQPPQPTHPDHWAEGDFTLLLSSISGSPIQNAPAGLSRLNELCLTRPQSCTYWCSAPASADPEATSAHCLPRTGSWTVRRNNTQLIPTFRPRFEGTPHSGTLYRSLCGKDTSQKRRPHQR